MMQSPRITIAFTTNDRHLESANCAFLFSYPPSVRKFIATTQNGWELQKNCDQMQTRTIARC